MIINIIPKLRKEKNITQLELANSLNVSRQTIISLEDNKCTISLELAFKISNYFNKPIEKIFMEKDMKCILTKKASTIEEIQQLYGKNTILIKGNKVFRCSTRELEIGPERLLNYDLPKYGQMKKFVVLNDEVYELIPTREYKDRNDIVKHKVGNKVDIDYSCINFKVKAWNEK